MRQQKVKRRCIHRGSLNEYGARQRLYGQSGPNSNSAFATSTPSRVTSTRMNPPSRPRALTSSRLMLNWLKVSGFLFHWDLSDVSSIRFLKLKGLMSVQTSLI